MHAEWDVGLDIIGGGGRPPVGTSGESQSPPATPVVTFPDR